jgi:small subunit ribosomal protein S17
MIGRVVSVKTKNTATVLVTSRKTHPLYKKSYVYSKRYLVDDQLGVTLGQIVEIVPCRPISKMKTWTVTKVVGRDMEAIIKEELKEAAKEAIEEVMPVQVEQEAVDNNEAVENVEAEVVVKKSAKKAKKETK